MDFEVFTMVPMVVLIHPRLENGLYLPFYFCNRVSSNAYFNHFFIHIVHYFDATAIVTSTWKWRNHFTQKVINNSLFSSFMCEKENSKFSGNILNFLIERAPPLKIPKSPRKILPSNDSFFKFLILCHWLASKRNLSLNDNKLLELV